MIRAFVFIESEPARTQELVNELAGLRLAASSIKEVHAITGRWDLVALIESPDIASLGDGVANGIGNAVGVRHTETSLIIWSGISGQERPAGKESHKSAPPAQIFNAAQFYDAGDAGHAFGPMDEIAALVRQMEPGQKLEIHATDPTVASDLSAWCRMTGHILLDQHGANYLIQHKQ